MSSLKIDDYENTGDSFTFPYNPNSVEFVTSKFLDQRNLPYSFTFLGMTSPVKSSINITLTGHFDSATKNSNYRSLVAKINAPILTRLFFQTDYDKFYLCTGAIVQKIPSGNRPLHVDYVASFFSPFGILFDATQQSGLQAASDSNDGDMVTPIEKITGSVTNGVAVTIEDANGNGFTFTPSATGTMTYNIVKMVSDDNTVFIAEYMYVIVGSTVQIIQNATTSGDLMLKLEPGESLNDIFSGGTISGITPTFFFRNGWASD